MKKTRLSKPLAILLALIMVISLLPISALAADTMPPEMVSLTATVDGVTTTSTNGTFSSAVGDTVSSIKVLMSEEISLIGSPVVTMGGGEIPDGTQYGTVTMDAVDTLVVTPDNGNETAGQEGTFTFTLAAGSLKDTSDNENEAITFVLTVVTNTPPTLKSGVAASTTAEVTAGDAYTLDLTTIFEDADSNPLTYTVSINGAEAVPADASYSYTPTEAGDTTLVFTANDGYDDSATYTVALTAAGSGEVSEVTVSIETSWNLIKTWELYAYSDKNNDTATPIITKNSPKPYKLEPGDYWIKGMLAQTFLGGIKITVDAEHTEFKLCGSQISCGNAGWEEGTDYTKTVAVKNQNNSVTREIELGAMGPSAVLLALRNDTVIVTIIPSEAKKAEGYTETVGTTNPLTGVELITVTCKLSVDVTFTAPAGSEIQVGQQQGYYTYLYETPVSTTSDGSGVSATYTLRRDTTYFYRVSHPDGVTYWKFNKWAEDDTVDVSAEDLHLSDDAFTKSTVIRDFSSNKSDVGSIYLNINEKGYLALEQGGTYALNVSRSWQAIESIANSETALPDMHYAVIDPETGDISDVVTIAPGVHNSSTATLTAAKAGTAIVLVTYDAMSYPGALNAIETDGVADHRFSAIWPENTGVFVVSVGSDGSAIATNMTINEGRNDTKVEKAVGDVLDGELDVLYYVDGTDGASYTFIPESGCTVSVLHPTLTEDSMTYSGGFEDTDVAVDGETGAVTVSGLTEGRHIVKVTKGDVSTYQVITAKPLTYTMYYKETKEPVTADTVLKPEEQIVIQYSGLFDPAGKLAGIYNFNTGVNLQSQTGDQFNGGGGAYGVYDFPTKTAFQMVSVTVPTYITSDTLELTGCLRQGGYGSPLGTHRALDYSVGVNPNFSAPKHRTFMGALPSITLKVEYDKDMPYCLIQPMDGNTPIEDFTIVDLKDADGNAVYPTGGAFRATAGTYTFAIRAQGYQYYEGSVTVTTDGENLFQITMTKLGANPWDGATLTEPQKDGDGTYLIGTGAELAWYIDYLTDDANDRTVNARLIADIELAGYPFITGAYLYGTFDGAGHKIDNLYIQESSRSGVTIGGLFAGIVGYGTKDGVTQNAAVKNVTVNGTIDVTISISNSILTGDTTVGGIMGAATWTNTNQTNNNSNRSCAVTNCVSNVDITVNGYAGGTSTHAIFVGGIAARSLGLDATSTVGNIGLNQVMDCVNNGNIMVNTSGKAMMTINAGGVTGKTGLGTELRNVSNHGNVNVRVSNETIRDMNVGGVAGLVHYNRTYISEGNTDTPTVLAHMWNTGAVNAVYEGEGTDDSWYDGMRIGGIAGALTIFNNLSSKSFCGAYNQGAVSAQWITGAGTPDVGGIIGWISPNTGEAFEASELYTTQGMVLGGTRYDPDDNDYIYTFTNSYYQAEEASSFGTKLDPAVLTLTPETVQEADKTNVRNYCNALKCIPEAALTQADRTNLAKLARLLDAPDVAPSADNSTTEGASATVSPETTVANGKATANVAKADIDAILDSAEENGTTGIVIDAKTDETATKSTVELPAGSASDMANAGMSLTVETSTGTFDVDNDALKEVAAAGDGEVELSTERLDADGLSDANKELVGDHPVFDLSITVGGTKVTDFGDGEVTVSLPYTPTKGEDTSNLTIYYIDDAGNAVEMTGAYYDEATGMIIFKTDHFSKFAVVNEGWTNPFTDVTTDDWFYDEVLYVAENGLMNGTSETLFSPDADMTRAMFVTVLYRQEGKPTVTADNPFTDVEDGEWYTNAVIWASENDIVDGYGNGLFGTNDKVTREQMAKMLYSYAEYKSYDVTAAADLAAFTDAEDISDWAETAMTWANAMGYITGRTETTLVPLGNATRAEVATIFMRFADSVEA